MQEGSSRRWVRRLGLPHLRGAVRAGPYRRLWALSTLAYVVVSLFIGQMLILEPPTPGSASIPTQLAWLGPGQVNSPYLAPALLLTSPYLVLALPFWGTLVMVLLGLGIGLSIASMASVFLEARRRQADLAAGGTAPAVTGWALLGACCCTSCTAQVAATGVVGAVAGSTPSALLFEGWPLAVLQLGVVALSLLYLEYRLERPVASPPASVRSSRLVAAVAGRVLLLIASVTWLFALVVEGTQGVPVTAATAYHWVVEHGLLSGLALVSALAPWSVERFFSSRARRGAIVRGVLLLGALTWGIGVPGPLVGAGLGGTLNELAGFLGVPPALGGVAPDATLGAALFFHWAFQHLLLAGWAILVAIQPTRWLRAIGIGEPSGHDATVARTPPVPATLVEAEGGP